VFVSRRPRARSANQFRSRRRALHFDNRDDLLGVRFLLCLHVFLPILICMAALEAPSPITWTFNIRELAAIPACVRPSANTLAASRTLSGASNLKAISTSSHAPPMLTIFWPCMTPEGGSTHSHPAQIAVIPSKSVSAKNSLSATLNQTSNVIGTNARKVAASASPWSGVNVRGSRYVSSASCACLASRFASSANLFASAALSSASDARSFASAASLRAHESPHFLLTEV
jgi:hypothetical protein